MDYIPAPWRAEYVRRVYKMKGCIFCQALKDRNKKSLVLLKADYNFIMLNKYPYTPGHLMIAPKEHLDSIEKASKPATDEMTDLLKISMGILRERYNPQGFNTGMNIGKCAGAGVAGHFHLHIIPRWPGDSNFMPLVGKTRVVIEDLQETYDGLLPLFQKTGKTRAG
jgi:ATP adenylyltransferase